MNPFLQDLSVLLIESGPKKAWENELTKSKESFSNRVSSLNTSTRNLLEKIDIWDVIKTCSCQNVTQMKVKIVINYVICRRVKFMKTTVGLVN